MNIIKRMSYRHYSCLALLCCLGISPSLQASDSNMLEGLRSEFSNEWRLVKNDKHRQIKTYAKLEDDKRIRSFKVEALLKTKAETLVRVMLNFANYSDWYWEVQHSRLLKQVSPTEYYIYIIHTAPYGLANRDVILHAVVEPQTINKPYVMVTTTSIPDFLPEKPPLIRMPAENMVIKFTPLPNHVIQVDAEGYVDPGGKVPVWDANLYQRNAPYAVILGLQRMALQDKYMHSHSELPFPVFNYDNLP